MISPSQQRQMPLYYVMPSQARVRRRPTQARLREAFSSRKLLGHLNPTTTITSNPTGPHGAQLQIALLRRPSHLTTSTDELQAPGESTPALMAPRTRRSLITMIRTTRDALRSTVWPLLSLRSGAALSFPVPKESSWLTGDAQADRLWRHRTVSLHLECSGLHYNKGIDLFALRTVLVSGLSPGQSKRRSR